MRKEISLDAAKRIMRKNGGSLDLSGTGIAALPDGLTVGGSLFLSGTGITDYQVKKLRDGDYKESRYLWGK